MNFTWTNGSTHSRLDRFLFTTNWEQTFQTIKQEALIKVESDHFPLVLDTNPFKWGPTPFRFENMWLSHKDFVENFKKWWEESEVRGWEGFKFMKKLEQVKQKLKAWNTEVFGDVRIIKGQILKRIQEIDKEEVRGVLREEVVIERRELKEKLGDVLLKEEVSWNQKAKVKGVVEWDANSKLFHRIINQKKVNKLICKLEKEDGSIVEEENEIVKEVVEFFKKLYSKKERSQVGFEGIE